jgi:hypothetical protein
MLWLGCHSAKLAKLDEAMRAKLGDWNPDPLITHSYLRQAPASQSERRLGCDNAKLTH